MSIELPPRIAAYFASDRSGDPEAFLQNFTRDAMVIDERQTHVGHDQIRLWKTRAAAQYSYTIAPHSIIETSGQTIVTAQLTGTFPGSPVDLRYVFSMDSGLISRLEIAP